MVTDTIKRFQRPVKIALQNTFLGASFIFSIIPGRTWYERKPHWYFEKNILKVICMDIKAYLV